MVVGLFDKTAGLVVVAESVESMLDSDFLDSILVVQEVVCMGAASLVGRGVGCTFVWLADKVVACMDAGWFDKIVVFVLEVEFGMGVELFVEHKRGPYYQEHIYPLAFADGICIKFEMHHNGCFLLKPDRANAPT